MLWELGSEMREVYTWASVLLVCVQVWWRVCVCVCVRAHRGGEDGVNILGNLSDHAPTKSLQRALVAFNFTARPYFSVLAHVLTSQHGEV